MTAANRRVKRQCPAPLRAFDGVSLQVGSLQVTRGDVDNLVGVQQPTGVLIEAEAPGSSGVQTTVPKGFFWGPIPAFHHHAHPTNDLHRHP